MKLTHPALWWLLIPIITLLTTGIIGLAHGATTHPCVGVCYRPSPIETPTHIHHACHWRNCDLHVLMRTPIH